MFPECNIQLHMGVLDALDLIARCYPCYLFYIQDTCTSREQIGMIDLRNGKDYVEFCSFVGR
jgi:hypothetical protein